MVRRSRGQDNEERCNAGHVIDNCMLSSVPDRLCHGLDSEKDGEGRTLGRATGMLYPYKSSHDAILSHVGSGSDWFGVSYLGIEAKREEGWWLDVCLYSRPPGRVRLGVWAVAQTKSSDQRAKRTNQATEKASAI